MKYFDLSVMSFGGLKQKTTKQNIHIWPIFKLHVFFSCTIPTYTFTSPISPVLSFLDVFMKCSHTVYR